MYVKVLCGSASYNKSLEKLSNVTKAHSWQHQLSIKNINPWEINTMDIPKKDIKTEERLSGNTPILTVVKPNTKVRNIAKVEGFFVTTDSVVAKATIVTDRKTNFLAVNWGDGETSNINIKYAKYFKIPAFDGSDSLQPGTYEFYHKYDVTYHQPRYDGELRWPVTKEYTVTLVAIDSDGGFDIEFESITIAPKYRVNFYSLSVGLKNQCDDGGRNEFTVIQTIDGEIVKDWPWHPSDNIFYHVPTYRLGDSQTSQIFEVTDEGDDLNPQSTRISVVFSFTEDDPSYDDKGSLHYPSRLQAYLRDIAESASGRFEGEIRAGDENPWPLFENIGCDIYYAVDWDLRLLVPLPTGNELIFNALP